MPQNLVHLRRGRVGRRAVVVGAELVSFSAVLTLRRAGCRAVLMTTTQPTPESYAAFTIAARSPLLGVPVATRTRVARIIGDAALRGVEVEDLDTGRRRTVECDTVILTGDWIPDHELARQAGLEMDPGSRGTAGRLRAADQPNRGVRDRQPGAPGGHRRRRRARRQPRRRPRPRVPAGRPNPAPRCRSARDAAALADPGLLRDGDPLPPRRRLLAWTDTLIRVPTVTAHQDGALIGRRRLPWAASPAGSSGSRPG